MIKTSKILVKTAILFARLSNGSVSLFFTYQPRRPESMK